MAIHPTFANAILDGRKRVEFRKRALAPDVSTVVVYATAPVKYIIGEFDLDGTVSSTPDDVWAAVGDAGCIDHDSYAAYYAGSRLAVGILISAARRYAVPVALADLDPEPAVPQSFAYLPAAQLLRIQRRAGAGRLTKGRQAPGAGAGLHLPPGDPSAELVEGIAALT